MVNNQGFIPLDRQIYMSSKKAVTKTFKDKRSASARDIKRAETQNKNQMLKRMLKSAIRNGYKAKYVLADSWFGNKGNLETILQESLHAIFQMKRGKQTYKVDGTIHTAQSLYTKYQRKLQSISEQGLYKTYRIEAEINLETNPKKPERWQKVVFLVLSAPKRSESGHWVIFLSTDLSLNAEELLSVYAKRWSIEVYFKEAKQSFGLLAEQSGKYQVSYASIHLAAVRYLIIYEAMQRKGTISFGEQRDKISGTLQILTYSGLLWQLFRSLITGVLNKIKSLTKTLTEDLLERLDLAVEEFLNQALQIEASTESAR